MYKQLDHQQPEKSRLEQNCQLIEFIAGLGIFSLHTISSWVQYRNQKDGVIDWRVWLTFIITLIIKQLFSKTLVKVVFKKCLGRRQQLWLFEYMLTIKLTFCLMGIGVILFRLIVILNVKSGQELKIPLIFNLLLISFYLPKAVVLKILKNNELKKKKLSAKDEIMSENYQLQ